MAKKKEELGPAEIIETSEVDLDEGRALDECLELVHDIVREAVDIVGSEASWGERHAISLVLLDAAQELSNTCAAMAGKEDADEVIA